MNLNVLRVKVKGQGLIPALLAKQASPNRPFLSHVTGPFPGHVSGPFPAHVKVHMTGLLTAPPPLHQE